MRDMGSDICVLPANSIAAAAAAEYEHCAHALKLDQFVFIKCLYIMQTDIGFILYTLYTTNTFKNSIAFFFVVVFFYCAVCAYVKLLARR